MSDLEKRVEALEDRLAILDLISRYGPAADSGESSTIATLWEEDGTYTFDTTTLVGESVGALVNFDTHQAYMSAGCAHFLSTPRIDLDGNHAVAVNHSIVLQRQGQAWAPVRVSANRWELTRVSGRWKVAHRTAQLLDGSEQARALLSALP